MIATLLILGIVACFLAGFVDAEQEQRRIDKLIGREK